jgi:hypothetical protein
MTKLEPIDWQLLEDFVQHLHEKEIHRAQIRRTLYEIIFTIEQMQPSDITHRTHNHRSHRTLVNRDALVHCQCESFNDDTALKQCYACHVSQWKSIGPTIDGLFVVFLVMATCRMCTVE